jgi:hypothetical protein
MINKYRSLSQPVVPTISLNARLNTNQDENTSSRFSIKLNPRKKPSLPTLKLMKPYNESFIPQLSTQPIPLKFVRLDSINYDNIRKKITTREKCRKIIDKIENSFELQCLDQQPF